MKDILFAMLAATLLMASAPLSAQAPSAPSSSLSSADTSYWLDHSRRRSADRQRLARIAQVFADAPLPDGWVLNQPSATMQLWDFDADGLLESYTVGQSSSDRDKHALLVAERQGDGSWTTGKVADTAEFALIRLTIVAPGRYRTGCNNCSENDTRSVVLDRVGLEYKSGYVQRYFVPARDGLVEVTGKR